MRNRRQRIPIDGKRTESGFNEEGIGTPAVWTSQGAELEQPVGSCSALHFGAESQTTFFVFAGSSEFRPGCVHNDGSEDIRDCSIARRKRRWSRKAENRKRKAENPNSRASRVLSTLNPQPSTIALVPGRSFLLICRSWLVLLHD